MVKSGITKSVLLLAFIGIITIGLVQPIAGTTGQGKSSGQDSSGNGCNDSSSRQMSWQDSSDNKYDSSKDNCENSLSKQDFEDKCEESAGRNYSTQADTDCDYHMKEAIKIHEMHLINPSTMTEESNMEMMDHMVEAYKCLTGENLTTKMVMKSKEDLDNKTMMTEEGFENETIMHRCMMNCMKGEHPENKTMMMKEGFENETMMHRYMMHCMMNCMKGVHAENKTMMPCMMKDRSANETMMPCMVEGHSTNESYLAGMDRNTNSAQFNQDCAVFWLKKAIKLHALHMKCPSTETEKSQIRLMFQMVRVHMCIIENTTATDKVNETVDMMNKKADNMSTEWVTETAVYLST